MSYVWFLVVGIATASLATFQTGGGGDGRSTKITKQETEINLANTLHGLLRDKMEDVREIILHGHSGSDIPELDPLRINAMSLMIQEPKGFLNVSLHKTIVNGLGDFRIKDIASNFDLMRTSVLMTCPELKIFSNYKIKGFLNPPLSQSINDAGRFEATIRNFHSSWSAKVKTGKRDTDIIITQTSFKTFYDDVARKFHSYLNKRTSNQSREILQTVGDAIIEKLQNAIEDHVYQSIQQVLGKGTGANFEDLAEDYEINKAHSRKKRQVPCSDGEELDEYVDTLLRFGRRLLRLMEPFRFPNTTVKVEDYELLVFLYNGGVRGVASVERRKPAYVICRNDSITLGLVIGFGELKVNAKYRVIKDYRTLLFNGDADIRVTGTEVLAQITQMTNGVTSQNLDKLRIRKLGTVRILLRGLGNLTSAISMLLTQQINDDPRPIIRVAEAQIISIARQQLANITIPIFSVI